MKPSLSVSTDRINNPVGLSGLSSHSVLTLFVLNLSLLPSAIVCQPQYMVGLPTPVYQDVSLTLTLGLPINSQYKCFSTLFLPLGYYIPCMPYPPEFYTLLLPVGLSQRPVCKTCTCGPGLTQWGLKPAVTANGIANMGHMC